MKHVQIAIEGKTPLIMHRFTHEAQERATSGNAISTVGDRGSPREQAQSHLYTDEAGEPIIPAPNLFRCIIDAGKFFKAGKSKVTTQKTSLIPACVDFGGTLYFKLESRDGWEVDTRPVRIPSTGGRILSHRPMFHDWRVQFTVDLDDTLISAKLLRDILDAAGSRIGLGAFRPDCKGPFGKFVVTKWEVS